MLLFIILYWMMTWMISNAIFKTFSLLFISLWNVPIKKDCVVVPPHYGVVVSDFAMINELIFLVHIELYCRLVVVHNMQIKDFACWPLLVQYLNSVIQELGTKAESSALIHHSNGHDISVEILSAGDDLLEPSHPGGYCTLSLFITSLFRLI